VIGIVFIFMRPLPVSMASGWLSDNLSVVCDWPGARGSTVVQRRCDWSVQLRTEDYEL